MGYSCVCLDTEETINIGPVINGKQKSKIMNLIQQSVEQGAKITTGGYSVVLLLNQRLCAM
jgi:acyl-CoA reductase-like NAD-dependent aldehyde dehydrogenase